MALVGGHQTLTFSSPVLSGAGVNANVVRGNDNVLRTALNAHDDDASIHVQSGTFANRPTTIADGATYFCTDTRDTYSRVAGAWVQSGWAHWYGGFSDYTDQAHTAINTAKAITFDTTDLSRGVTVVSTSRLTVAAFSGMFAYAFFGVASMNSVATFLLGPSFTLPAAAAYISRCCALLVIGIVRSG